MAESDCSVGGPQQIYLLLIAGSRLMGFKEDGEQEFWILVWIMWGWDEFLMYIINLTMKPKHALDIFAIGFIYLDHNWIVVI